MHYLSDLPKIAPILLFALLVVSFFFALGRDGIAPGWRRLPISRHEWTVLWFHSLESLVFCSTLAVMGLAGDVAVGLMLTSVVLLFVSAFAPVPLSLRVCAWIILLFWFTLGLFLIPVMAKTDPAQGWIEIGDAASGQAAQAAGHSKVGRLSEAIPDLWGRPQA